jgi:hypothetical protein
VEEQTTVGLIDMQQGGDDDDVFVAVHKMNQEKQLDLAMNASKTSKVVTF